MPALLEPRIDRMPDAALAATAVAGVAGVAGLRVGVATRRTSRVDAATRRWFLRRRSRLGDVASAVGTAIGQAEVQAPIAAALATWVAVRTRKPVRAVPLALSGLAAWGLQQAGKHALRRRRPPRAIREGKTEPSMPSGHATCTTAVGATAAYVLAREGMASPAVAFPVAVGVALLAGEAKLYAERHWLTDVLAGYLAGLAVAAGSALAYEAIRRRDAQ